jgi:hypothetical protein
MHIVLLLDHSNNFRGEEYLTLLGILDFVVLQCVDLMLLIPTDQFTFALIPHLWIVFSHKFHHCVEAQNYMIAHEYFGLEYAHLLAAVAIECLFGDIIGDITNPSKNIAEQLLFCGGRIEPCTFYRLVEWDENLPIGVLSETYTVRGRRLVRTFRRRIGMHNGRIYSIVQGLGHRILRLLSSWLVSWSVNHLMIFLSSIGRNVFFADHCHQ